MKKIFVLIMVMVLMFNMSTVNIFAAEYERNINITVDGLYVTRMDAKPFIEDNRTLVPVRAVAEKMGAEVLWDNNTRTVTMSKLNEKITYEGKEYFNCTTNAKLVIDQKVITIGLIDSNGVQVFSIVKEMDVAAKIVEGRTFIPARFVGYALGYSVSWIDARSLVVYEFVGKQTIDFGIGSDNPDPVKRIDYEYDKEKYPEKIVVNNVEYPCRKGYDDIVIIDASHSKIIGNQMIDVFPYRWTDNNYIIECDDVQYKIDPEKTTDENFQTFSKFYTDKVGENVIVHEGYYYDDYIKEYTPEFLTYENATRYREESASRAFKDYFDGYDYIDLSKTYYHIQTIKPGVDCTKMYFINENPTYGVGSKFYGWKTNELLGKANEKNTLLFLNSFLGETGQRLWTMMNDYYTLSGQFYVPQDTKWTKSYIDERTGYHYPEVLDPISTNAAEKYGFTVVENKNVSATRQLLVLKNHKQVIYIEYDLVNLMIGQTIRGYDILFETIED